MLNSLDPDPVGIPYTTPWADRHIQAVRIVRLAALLWARCKPITRHHERFRVAKAPHAVLEALDFGGVQPGFFHRIELMDYRNHTRNGFKWWEDVPNAVDITKQPQGRLGIEAGRSAVIERRVSGASERAISIISSLVSSLLAPEVAFQAVVVGTEVRVKRIQCWLGTPTTHISFL